MATLHILLHIVIPGIVAWMAFKQVKLMVPMQGHTHITRIACDYVTALEPRMVIPHHQDSFFPPISSLVPTQPFEEQIKVHVKLLG